MPFKQGHIPWNKNKHLSKEHRHKISQSNKRKTSSMKGLRHTDETRHKISIAKLGKKLSGEHCERISEGLNEYNAKIRFQRRSAGLKKYYETHEVWNKGLKWPSEVKERIRQACIESGVGKWNRKKEE